jgi:hypothetical protein
MERKISERPKRSCNPRPPGQVWKSYYFQGVTRLALRVQVNGVTDKVYYLLTDHLGSTTVSYRSDGGETRYQSYKPWGYILSIGNLATRRENRTGQNKPEQKGYWGGMPIRPQFS